MAAIGGEKKKLYAHCPARIKPNYDAVDEETSKQIATNYRVMPMFEKGMFDYVYKQHYSLERNDNLKCAWKEYKKNLDKKITKSFQFPNDRDIHFYNCGIRFLPSESLHSKPSFRNSLKPGPGFDYGGQMPIPQELLMKRTSGKTKSRKRPSKKEKTKAMEEKKKE